jgi:hypothetical protein
VSSQDFIAAKQGTGMEVGTAGKLLSEMPLSIYIAKDLFKHQTFCEKDGFMLSDRLYRPSRNSGHTAAGCE